MTDQPTPSERRDAIAAGLYRKIGVLWPKRLAEEACAELADALMPLIEEWLADVWDECCRLFQDDLDTYGANIVKATNPYRKATP